MNTTRLILFVFFIAFLTSCNDKNSLKISGEISNASSKTLLLQELGIRNAITLDSVKLNSDGSFKFKLPRIEHPKYYLIKLSEENFITLLADSTENIEIMANAEDLTKTYTVKNSLGSNYIKVLNTKFNKTKKAIDSLAIIYEKNLVTDKYEAGKAKAKIAEAVDDQKEFINDFVMANPRSFASYYAIFQRYDNGNLVLDPFIEKELILFNTVATSLNVIYPKAPRTKQLKNFVLGIQKELRSQQLKEKLISSQSVNTYPEIEMENLNGKKVKLSSLNGKLILLSFWASWDKKSRSENKNLLSIYKKYKSKGFEIYQVSLDRSKLLWEDAIKQDKLPWINVSDLQYTNSYAARLYNIQQLPANYLISKKGDIIGKNLFGRILDEKLSDILN